MELIKSLFGSKKFIAMISGIIFTLIGKIGFDIPEETITQIVSLVAAYLVAQGASDLGKGAK